MENKRPNNDARLNNQMDISSLLYQRQKYKSKYTVYIIHVYTKCSDRSMEVRLPILLGNY